MKKKFNYLLLLVFSIIVIYFALKDNYQEIINQMLNIKITYLILAIVFVVIYWFAKALILFINTRNFKKDFKLGKAILIILKTQFWDGVTPFSTGGQPFEIYMLKKENVRLSDSTGIIASTSFVYQLTRAIICLASILLNLIFKVIPFNNVLYIFILLGFIVNSLVALFYYLLMFSKKFSNTFFKLIVKILNNFKIVKDKESTIEKLEDSIKNYHKSSKYIMENRKDFNYMVIINIIGFIGFFAVPYALFKGVGFNSINFLYLFISNVFGQVVGSFIPIPGSTGGLEYCFIAYIKFAVKGELNGVMILWRFITYYLQILIGVVLINKKERND